MQFNLVYQGVYIPVYASALAHMANEYKQEQIRVIYTLVCSIPHSRITPILANRLINIAKYTHYISYTKRIYVTSQEIRITTYMHQ